MNILIIKPQWLNKIFHTRKTLEIRGSNTSKRGIIELAESGTSLIKGCCELDNSYPIVNEEQWEELKKYHQVNISWDELLNQYEHPYAWVFKNVKEYTVPEKYFHPKGAVIWVKNNKSIRNNIL